MIISIRKYLQGSVLKIVMWFFLFAFAIGSVPLLIRRATTGGPWVVRVGGQEIGFKEYLAEVAEQREYIAALRAQYGESVEYLLQMMGMHSDAKALALNNLVRQELIAQAAQAEGLYLSPDYISESIVKLLPAQLIGPDGAIDQKILQAFLQHRGMSVADFERKAERILEHRMLTQMVNATVYVPEFEVRQRYAQDSLGKKYSILSFSLEDYVKKAKKSALTDQEVQSFYNEQNARYKRYWTPELRDVRTWKYTPESYGIEVSDAQIQGYYARNSDAYLEKPESVQVRRILFKKDENAQVARKNADAALARVQADTNTFAQVAREVSQDQETKNNGGLLPAFEKGTMDRALDRAAFILKQPGDISQVIETANGFEIIQLVEKKPRVVKPLSAVKGEIEKTLAKESFERAFSRDVKRLQAGGAPVIDAFVAEKKVKDSLVSGLENNNSALAGAAFKLKLNGVGSYMDQGVGILVQVVGVTPSRQSKLEEVATAVREDLYAKKGNDLMAADAFNAYEKAKTQDFESIKQEYGANLEKTGFIHSQDRAQTEILHKKGIPSSVLQIEKEGVVVRFEGKDGAVLVRVDAIEPIEAAAFDESKGAIFAQSTKQKADALAEGFVASLYRNAKIDTNESVITAQD